MEMVFLHGPGASGKLTVARALNARLNYGIFHNHLIVNALTSVFQFGSAPFVRLREQFWLSTFAEAAMNGANLIFTFTPESTIAPGFAESVRRTVEDAGGGIRFVQLAVSESEQERRIDAPSRHEFAKLTDLATLRRLRAEETHFDIPPTELLIDTVRSSPDESAQLIVDTFALEPAAPHERFPSR